ncbi:AAA family ATPase [Prevotella sp.]|uniref:AAA family ATPase n=1 Tax=Prevotella sp. TaxID=59823 RepID=UPI002E7658EC|nr:AAA family ATPase [Prevotella sp.]MEE0670169.1 AAA family ATPase [Prevotella sp.]
MKPINLPLQQIYYGAPGTGKSYEIDKITKRYGAIRTTFHPDSDYSTFVGAYKPTMTKVELRDMSGHLVKEEGTTRVVKEDRITYKFVKQAFLKAYLSAWKKYAEGDKSGIAPQFLVIEEINRGNCAQIFGDLFQLLDRQDNGFSSYPIEADADLQMEIAEAFKAEKDYMLTKELNLQGVVKDYVGNLAEDIKSGKILLLPSNFYIWATMNTSDQSLFPIDSAFKRRWDWHYVKIADAKKDYKIKCGDEVCDWWIFVQAVNEKIAEETSSDDKKLGYFFCKPQNEGESIGVERFVSKVLFYLWNDVFKDGNTTDFNVSDNSNKQPSFDAFYNDDNTINIENVRKFLVNIVGENGLRKVCENDFEEYLNEDIEDGDGDGKDHTKYAINGEGRISKRKIAVELVKKYIDNNPTLSAKEVADKWKMLGNEINISYIVETQEDYNNDTRNTKDRRLKKIICNGEPLWVGTHGWGTVEKMNELKAALSKRNWGLSISEIQE